MNFSAQIKPVISRLARIVRSRRNLIVEWSDWNTKVESRCWTLSPCKHRLNGERDGGRTKTGVGNHGQHPGRASSKDNNGFSFPESEDRSGSALAALPPSCSEENDWASHRAAENPSPRQPIDCSMERVEEASGSQFPQQHIPEAVQSPHAGV